MLGSVRQNQTYWRKGKNLLVETMNEEPEQEKKSKKEMWSEVLQGANTMTMPEFQVTFSDRHRWNHGHEEVEKGSFLRNSNKSEKLRPYCRR
jgi:hypothetical protein